MWNNNRKSLASFSWCTVVQGVGIIAVKENDDWWRIGEEFWLTKQIKCVDITVTLFV